VKEQVQAKAIQVNRTFTLQNLLELIVASHRSIKYEIATFLSHVAASKFKRLQLQPSKLLPTKLFSPVSACRSDVQWTHTSWTLCTEWWRTKNPQ